MDSSECLKSCNTYQYYSNKNNVLLTIIVVKYIAIITIDR